MKEKATYNCRRKLVASNGEYSIENRKARDGVIFIFYWKKKVKWFWCKVVIEQWSERLLVHGPGLVFDVDGPTLWNTKKFTIFISICHFCLKWRVVSDKVKWWNHHSITHNSLCYKSLVSYCKISAISSANDKKDRKKRHQRVL